MPMEIVVWIYYTSDDNFTIKNDLELFLRAIVGNVQNNIFTSHILPNVLLSARFC